MTGTKPVIRSAHVLAWVALTLLVPTCAIRWQHQGIRGDSYKPVSFILNFLRQWATPTSTQDAASRFVAIREVAATLGLKVDGVERNPIIFIPPLTGAQLEVKLDKRKEKHWWCSRSTRGWRFVWFSYFYLLPGFFSCFVDDLRLGFNSSTGLSTEPVGVQVRPKPGFNSAMFLTHNHQLPVYATMADALGQLGWVEGYDLLAHLYDWRKSPLDWLSEGGSFQQLEQEIAEAVQRTGRKAVVVGLSMAGPYFSAFLQHHVSPEWTAAHVESLVAISGFWGGTTVAALALLSGSATRPEFRNSEFTELLRHLPAISWLLPHPELFRDEAVISNEPLARNFTADDISSALQLAGANQAAVVGQAVRHITTLIPLNVSTFCIYGTGVPTPGQLAFHSKDFSDIPTVTFVDGDGTVPLSSMQVCQQWQGQQAQPVQVTEIPGLPHANVLGSRDGFLAVLKAILTSGVVNPQSNGTRLLPSPS